MTRESKVRIGKSIYFDNIAPLYNYFNYINYIHQWFSPSVCDHDPPFKNNWSYSTVCVETAHTSSLPFASFHSELGNCNYRHVFHQTSPQRVWYSRVRLAFCVVFFVAYPSMRVWMRQAKTKPPKSHLVWRQHIWKRTNSAANTANRMFHSK